MKRVSTNDALTIKRIAREGELPLSFAQQGLWFIHRLEPNNAFYNIPIAVQLTGPLKVDALERALGEILNRHEVLRTCFPDIKGKPVQRIVPHWPLTLPVVDLSNLPFEQRRPRMMELAGQEANQPFDLGRCPLFRTTLIRLDNREHVLLFIIHHIISDGWSNGVIVREVTALYSAFSKHLPSPLGELDIQYADYAAWQQQYLSGSVLESHLSYWKKQLAGALPMLDLPTDRARSPLQTYRGAREPLQLAPTLSRSLKEFSRRMNATLFMTLLSAFKVLLHRYTEQNDMAIGTPVAGRTHVETEQLIGLFINTLVLRTDLSGNPTFRDLLRRVSKTAWEAFANQDLPFSLLVDELAPRRSLSHSPLFQVLFVFDTATIPSAEVEALKLNSLDVGGATTQFDLTVSIVDTAKGLEGYIEFSTDLFDESTIKRMNAHFQSILKAVMANPGAFISDIPLLSEDERRQLLTRQSRLVPARASDQCAHELFEAQAESTPQATALIFGSEQVSYGELNARASRLARHLRASGVGPESIVGLCAERSPEMVAAMIGVLKAGGAYLPLDPMYPKERLAFMLNDAGVQVLLCEQHLLSRLPKFEGIIVCLGEDWREIESSGNEHSCGTAAPDNLAYVLYTSGTTGKPKAVLTSHAALVSYARVLMKQLSLTSSDRILQFASMSFDVSVEEIFCALLSGGGLVLPEKLIGPTRLSQEMTRYGVTIADLPVVFWQQWTHELLHAAASLPPSLRLIIIGGEKINSEAYAIWRSSIDHKVKLANMYGVTEATVSSTIHWAGTREAEKTGLPIGRALDNTDLFALNRSMQPAPVGAKGELHIGGEGLARGYLNRPDLTAEKFIPDPFSSKAGARLYRTGDLARCLPDGSLEFLSRTDQQVKVRGFRIELAEVEAALAQHGAVREVAVMVREDPHGGKQLTAYLCLDDTQLVTITDLRNFLARTLPDYMLPSAFVMLKELPVTPNGKVDYNALPAASQSRPQLEEEYVAPRNPMEEVVASVWSEILSVHRVGAHDDFFELGGHSLLATQIVARLSDLFGVDLALRQMFESPTVAQLAGAIEEARTHGLTAKAPPLSRASRKGEIPLSYAQQRLWFIDQLSPGTAAYIIPVALRLKGVLNVTALQRCLDEIVRRHESLRTTFAAVDAQPVQIIAPALSLDLPIIDLQCLNESERQAEAARLATQQVHFPFDLQQGPLVRAQLLRLSEQEHVLIVAMHHLISDGWSMGVMVREFSSLYRAYCFGEPSPLPDLPVQYADFAIWQRGWLQGEILEAHLAYWKRQLAGAPELIELPTDHPRPSPASFRGAAFEVSLPQSLSDNLDALSRRESVTMFMTLLAAYQILLFRYNGQPDIVVGAPVANRTRPELERLIGFFVNPLVLRTDLSGDPSYMELLARVREVTLAAYAHQDLPFERLVDELHPHRDLGSNPIFQTAFALQNTPMGGLELPGLTLSNQEFDVEVTRFDLEMHLREHAEGLKGFIVYSTDLFETATVSRMFHHFQSLLNGIAADPDRRISTLPLLTEAEQEQLLFAWNATSAHYSTDRPVHHLIAAQTARTPDALAISFGEQRLTYAELDRRANQLANYLRRLGVGPESLTGICIDRSIEWIVGMTAIFKAGGAYVPLDPAYPKERLAFMIEDSEVRVVLTTKSRAKDFAGAVETIIRLDSDWEAISREDESQPATVVTADHLAYVIYTSGSTGKPKGVAITHGSLLNLIFWHQRAVRATASDRACQIGRMGFDASVWEVWPYLTIGASVLIIGDETRYSAEDIADWFVQEKITVSWLPPILAEKLILSDKLQRQISSGQVALRVLLSGADKLAHYPPDYLSFEYMNAYGPTEATVVTISGTLMPDRHPERPPSLGRPVANTEIYLLDERLQPVPIGVRGEMRIGGDSLARCYWNQPAMTAEKFTPDPFTRRPGRRLYKTGDFARYLADGNIEFIGRVDNEIKIRGFRVNPAEIEAALTQHTAVQQAAVIAREDAPGEKQLVAYVVVQEDSPDRQDRLGEWQQDRVRHWQMLYEDTYKQSAAHQDPTFNITGWSSSYTGAPIPEQEMRVWRDSTVERILRLRPKEVLEIGCGSGLLLYKIAAQCERYWGTDFSAAALASLRQQVELRSEQLGRVTLLERRADEFEGIPEHGFDAVLLNSVAQYFPDLSYLLEVLHGALKVVRPGGFIFLGDLRNYELIEAFHTSVELYKATSWMSARELRQRIRESVKQEGELLIGPGLFEEFKRTRPEISRVEILLKRGRDLNELTRFRYDAILHLAEDTRAARSEPACASSKQTILDWTRDGLSLGKLQELFEEAPDEVLITQVPNARVIAEVTAVELLAQADGPQTVAELRKALAEKPLAGVDPEDLWAAGEPDGYRINVGWSDSPGCFDLEVRKTATAEMISGAGQVSELRQEEIAEERSLNRFANKPFKAFMEQQLVPELRSSLMSKLPDYMVPPVFVMLDELPLTPNGKVDRRALPDPRMERAEPQRAQAGHRNQEEEILIGIWRQVLNGKSVGIAEKFFDLGGDSLQATQVVSRVKEVFGVKISLRNIFEGATIEDMAATIKEARARAGTESAPQIMKADRTGRLPLSFAQQRLWFLTGLQPDSPFYNIATAVRLSGELDVEALRKTFNEIVRRHEVLRTNLIAIDGEPVQVIEPELTLPLPIINLARFPAPEREAEAKRLALEESSRLFNLAQCPLLRVSLLKMGEDEHLALMTMHHIISDGWSMGVLVKELAILYEAFSTGAASPLPELPIQYADFAVWQRDWLSGDVLNQQLAYWREKLRGAPALLELPTDRARPAVQSFAGASLPIHLPAALTGKLRGLAQKEGATLFMSLLAGFDVLLSRYSNQAEVVVGTAIANRNRGELEGLIGFFVNTLALRVRVEGEGSYAELVRQVREETLGAYGQQEVPFEKVVEEIAPDRDLSHSPLFQVMFVWQNTPLEELELPGLRLTPVEIEDRAAEFDLMVSVSESQEGITGYIEYKTDLFDRATVLRFSEHFQRLLEAATDYPHQRVCTLPLLSDQEVNQLLLEGNGPEVDFPASLCVHELFEAQAERTPDAVAVVFNDRLLTYRKLDEQANRLAHYLHKLGVGPETIVGVCVRRSIEMIVGVLGIMKAGGAYVPLDPAYPAERLSLILKDCHAPLLLTLDSLTSNFPVLDATLVRLDSDWRLIAQESSDRPVNTTRADNLIYVIYTSGSTGRPKGVAMHHRALTNMLSWQVQGQSFSDGAKTLQFASLSFDVSFQEVFSTFLSGGTILLVEEDMRRDVIALSHLLKEAQVERLFLPFVALQQLAEASTGDGVLPDPLCEIVTAGEQLKITAPVAALLSRLNKCSLQNQYGPTETHAATSLDLQGAPEQWPALPPIGRPINNADVYVLDAHRQLVPPGVVGEIYIGGEGLGRGYLNRCETTAERFIPDPFSTQPGTRLYKSGDMARQLADATLEFLGRNDFQIKVRGYRVEIAEIETELARHPNVHQAVVVAHEDKAGTKRLVGYVVADKQARTAATELRDYLKGKLPDYMVPSIFLLVDQLPLSPNGKVDRRALPAPEQIEPDMREGFIAPRNPVEDILASIWSAVLDIERPSVSDNFFRIGGHSLLATQVVSRVRKAFGVEIAIRQLFEEPTLEGFARSVEAALREGQAMEAPPIIRQQRDRDWPLSFAQQRLWFIDQLQPGNPSYNLPTAVRMIGHLDAEILRRTLSAIIQRHEALRTTFRSYNGKPAQVINPDGQALLAVEDLSLLPEAARLTEAIRLTNEEAQRPFDLDIGPLLRTRLFRLGDEDHIAVLTMHHIISDGWSMGVLVKELAILYEAFSTGAASPLPELPIQYADFAVWQRDWLSGDTLDQQLAYWREKLRGAPALLELPTDRARPAVQSFAGASLPIHLSTALTGKLRGLAQKQGATLFMSMLAGFDVLLSRYSNQAEVVVGTAIANRNRGELEGLIGFFVNTLALRVRVEGEGSYAELVRQVREETLGAYGQQEVPFEKVVEEIAPDRDLSHSPLFQVMFVWQNAPVKELELPGLKLSPVTINVGLTRFDLVLNLYESGLTISGSLEYSSDLFDASTIERMWSHFENLLESSLDDPYKPVSLLPLLSEAELRQIIVEWNQTQVDYPNECAHHLFEAQVERTPDSVALAFNHRLLSYAELNARANQLAHYLRGLGVGFESLVGISMERGIDLIVGFLGILKAGGAYVPIDPTYPVERITFMLKDTRATILLTQQHLRASLPELGAKVICIDSYNDDIAACSKHNPIACADPGNLAYVIYTSGSTGKPKGVAIQHSNLANLVHWHNRARGVKPSDRASQVSTISFDASVLETWPYLAVGASLHAAGEEVRLNPSGLPEWFDAQDITVGFLPTPLAEAAISQQWPSELCLRALLTGGDKLHIGLREGLPFKLIDHYGPTENTVVTTCAEVGVADESASAPLIGTPIDNTEVFIVDHLLQPVPIGVQGELYTGGKGLARGYLDRPELTAEKFIPHPFSKEPGARLYVSGDLARYRSNGNIEFLGRADNQIKIRGFRVELGEIETTLCQHESVSAAVVTDRAGPRGVSRLVAYVVCDKDYIPSAGEFRGFLKERLPEYMVPSVFVTLESLPLTANGKIDRRALPDIDQHRQETGAVYEPPSNEVERQIARIWQELLQVEKVGAHDNFFDLGGHSLLLPEAHSRLREIYGSDLKLLDLFKYPTVSELARHLSQNGAHLKPSRDEALDAQQEVEMVESLAQGKSRLRRRLQQSQRIITGDDANE